MGSRILKVRPPGTQGWWAGDEPIWGRGFANPMACPAPPCPVLANPATSGLRLRGVQVFEQMHRVCFNYEFTRPSSGPRRSHSSERMTIRRAQRGRWCRPGPGEVARVDALDANEGVPRQPSLKRRRSPWSGLTRSSDPTGLSPQVYERCGAAREAPTDGQQHRQAQRSRAWPRPRSRTCEATAPSPRAIEETS